MYYFLIFLIIIVLIYKLYSYKEGFYHSINPCFDTSTPYIKYNDQYVCFDKKGIMEDTIIAFSGNTKNCLINPEGNTINMYDKDNNIIDRVDNIVTKQCKPYKVKII